ncbi:hypothetical protein ACQKP0_01330 [Heyndrickxia sp. NPDC080065]|uniref:hypothetical protein n=1 Tax=Heyndrickxia sp. NPDC080065 TaxID=3390568 RepID=UPI003D01D3DA
MVLIKWRFNILPKIKWKSLITPKFTKALINIIPTLVATILGDIVILLLRTYLANRFKLL